MTEEKTPGGSTTTPDRRVSARTGTGRYRTEVDVRGHTLTADEPEALGGGDAGPTPFDLLGAALASCTTMTLRMYADRKTWPLEGVVARVEHRRIVSGGADPKARPRDHFLLDVELHGPLDEAQRGRLLEIAHRCPVHRALLSSMSVDTRLV